MSMSYKLSSVISDGDKFLAETGDKVAHNRRLMSSAKRQSLMQSEIAAISLNTLLRRKYMRTEQRSHPWKRHWCTSNDKLK